MIKESSYQYDIPTAILQLCNAQILIIKLHSCDLQKVAFIFLIIREGADIICCFSRRRMVPYYPVLLLREGFK